MMVSKSSNAAPFWRFPGSWDGKEEGEGWGRTVFRAVRVNGQQQYQQPDKTVPYPF